MKANELRIGNWVYRGSEILFQVTALGIANFDQEDIHLTAVPLSSEWLEMAGFKRRENITLEKAQEWVLRLSIAGGNKNELWGMSGNSPDTFVCAICNDHWASENINEVHQLQNLYFALTGEELTFTDPTTKKR